MRSRTLAITGSIAALSFAAVPIAQAASTTTHPSTVRIDASRDATGVRHVDKTPDKRSAGTSRDVRDR
jgi:hypothetical protein